MESDAPSPAPQPDPGTTLADAASSGPIDHEQAVELTIALCELAAPSHQEGLAYGGLAPRLVHIDSSLKLRIGLGPGNGPLRDISEDNRDYVAPELLAGGDRSPRSDIYSLARILYRLLTGETPAGERPAAASSIAGSPLVLDTLIKKASAPEPEERIACVTEFANNLRQTTKLRPTISGPEAPVTRIARPPSPPSAVSTVKPTRSIEIPWGLIVKCVAAILLVGALIKVVANFGSQVSDNVSQTSSPPAQNRERVERLEAIERDRDRERERERRRREREREIARERESARPPSETASARAAVEPLRQSLPRLKEALRAGRRDEIPPAAFRRHDSTFAHWDRSMTWEQAKAFAEDHGAHLAILATREERQWARDTFDLRYPVWLGAGKGARGLWQWLDGTPFPSSRTVGTTEDRYLALNEGGLIIPATAKRKCDIILQWRDDGSNPGTRDEQLRRVKSLALAGSTATLQKGEGLPIGTRSFGNSHFYALRTDKISWEQALDIAAIHGAYPAVPSSAEEHQWICENFWSHLGSGGGLWLGGFRAQAGQPWQWISGEPWHNAGLASDAATHPLFNRLLLQGAGESGQGRWTMVDGTRRKVTGILLEWAPPAAQTAPPEEEVLSSASWQAALTRKTQQVVGADLSAFDWEKRKLVERYVREVKVIARAQKTNLRAALRNPGADASEIQKEMAEWEGLEQELVKSAEGTELLPALPATAPASLNRIHETATKSLSALEGKYDARIKGHLKAYRDKVHTRAKAAAAQGHLEAAGELRSGLRPLQPDLKAFLLLLFPENPDRATLPWEARREFPAEEPQLPANPCG